MLELLDLKNIYLRILRLILGHNTPVKSEVNCFITKICVVVKFSSWSSKIIFFTTLEITAPNNPPITPDTTILIPESKDPVVKM